MTDATTGVTMATRLQQRGSSIWAAAQHHPMIGEIGRGTLPVETFRFYFEQNLMYLEEYARSIAFVAAKAPDVEAITVLNRFLSQIVQLEIPANRNFLHRLGGTPRLDPSTAMTSANYNYTRHLLYTASQCSPAEGLSALLPCQWSYGEIATRLAKQVPDVAIYADWISLFTNPDYDTLIADSGSLLDRLATEEGRGVAELAPYFDRSSTYELEFWEMAYSQGHSGGDAARECDVTRGNYS